MKRIKAANSSHALAKKRKHLQEYFDLNHNNIVTPNQRSLPKYKNAFPPRHNKSAKKDQIAAKRMSQGRLDRKPKVSNSPPHQRYVHFENSIHRDYDSPSKDQEDIGFIVKGVQKKVKGNSTFV